MAVNFPDAPVLNDTFVAGGITFTWNGYGWASGGSGGAAQDIWVYRAGDTMTGDLTISGAILHVASAARGASQIDGGIMQTVGTATTNAQLNMDKRGAGAQILGNNTGVQRWAINLIDATAADNFSIVRYDNAGIPTGQTLSMDRANGATTLWSSCIFATPSVQMYYTAATPGSWNFCSDMTGATGQYMVPAGQAWVGFSDARLPYKISATPVSDTLNRLAGVQLYHNVTPSEKDEVFFKAQELAESLPELVVEGTGAQARDNTYVPTQLGDENAWGVMYDRCGAVALQAIKELLARVETLEGQLAARR